MSTSWKGRIFLGAQRLLYGGPVGPTRPHAHHAFQVVLGRSGPVMLAAPGCAPVPCRAALIHPGVPHQIVGFTASVVILYEDSESRVGRALRRHAPASDSPEGWRLLAEPLLPLLGTPAPSTWTEADMFGVAIVSLLPGGGAEPSPRHPALRRALAIVAASAPDERRSMRAVAAAAGLSESRLAHLFRAEVGLTFRAYARWFQLGRAARAIAVGKSLTEAAHSAGFSDLAHFTRTFVAMFGLAPTEVSRVVDWVEPP